MLRGRWAYGSERMPRGDTASWLRVPGCAEGQYYRAMEITELPPPPVVLPATGELVHIRTQEWALERWEGQDPPGLAVPWARKPKFSVDGSRSCAELAIVHHLRARGWDGGLGQCLPQRAPQSVVPGPGRPAARRGRSAWVGCRDFRPAAGREWRDAERVLRRVRLARTWPGTAASAETAPATGSQGGR